MLETTQTGLRGDPTRKSSLESPLFAEKYNFGDGEWAKVLAQTFGYGLPDYFPKDIITNAQLQDRSRPGALPDRDWRALGCRRHG
ncbi:MAG: hypothetical protein U0075_20650 [Thermomicrobiales bacterium]